jgi:hypothetical protein
MITVTTRSCLNPHVPVITCLPTYLGIYRYSRGESPPESGGSRMTGVAKEPYNHASIMALTSPTTERLCSSDLVWGPTPSGKRLNRQSLTYQLHTALCTRDSSYQVNY